MSELKALWIPTRSGNSLHCYLKSEADNVIAEKNKEIKRLENLCESYRIDCYNLAIREANAYKEIGRDNKKIRHQKYKRCLAMAGWCEERCARYDLLQEHSGFSWRMEIDFYFRWSQRWLELAEKFKDKEAK